MCWRSYSNSGAADDAHCMTNTRTRVTFDCGNLVTSLCAYYVTSCAEPSHLSA